MIKSVQFVSKQQYLSHLNTLTSTHNYAAVNMEMRQLVSVKNKEKKLRLAFVREELRAITDKTMLRTEIKLIFNF